MSIYSVWGPPQSGKTTLAVDLAYALSLRDLSVCLISAEPYSELSARMGIRVEPAKSLAAVGNSVESLRHTVCPVSDLLYVLAAPVENDAFGEGLSSEREKALLQQASAAFDAVIVDCSAHCASTLEAWALRLSEKVLFLTGGSTASALWCGAFRRAMDAVKDRTIPICAEVSANLDYPSLFRLESLYPQVRLPYIPDAAAQQTERHSLYGFGGKAGKAYSAGMDEICEILTGGEST